MYVDRNVIYNETEYTKLDVDRSIFRKHPK